MDNSDVIQTNNKVYLQGTVSSEPESLKSNPQFMRFMLEVPRLSENSDILPILCSRETAEGIKTGDKISVKGSIRTFDVREGDRSRLMVTVYARKTGPFDESIKSNTVELEAFVCKPPIFRHTPMNMEICDMMLAVKRNDSHNDYVPSIAWGRLAKALSHERVGNVLKVQGRLQSRLYTKKTEVKSEVRTAYELSIFAVIRDGGKGRPEPGSEKKVESPDENSEQSRA